MSYMKRYYRGYPCLVTNQIGLNKSSTEKDVSLSVHGSTIYNDRKINEKRKIINRPEAEDGAMGTPPSPLKRNAKLEF